MVKSTKENACFKYLCTGNSKLVKKKKPWLIYPNQLS